jgi:porin
VTQFAFQIDGGIDVPVAPPFGQGDKFKYTGRGEYDFIVDLEKFGGLPQGKLLIGAQHWWGEFGNVSLNTGLLPPAIFAAALPPEVNDPGVPFITDFLVTQPLSEKLVVFVGKKNVIGAADQDIFAGGDGTDLFMNQALIANPAFLLALPYTSFTAGAAMPTKWGMVSAFVYDPQDRTKDFFRLQDLFSEGVIVGGEVRVNTNLFDMPGEHHVGGIWKHTDLTDLRFDSPPPVYPYPPAPPGSITKPDSYTIYYGFDQYVQVYPGERRSPSPKKPPRGWGLFGRASISDGNPTPYRYFLSGGIGGDSPLGCHRGDTFGVGWFYKGTSNEFGPIPAGLLGPRDGVGVEVFYNFQVNPWLNITPDVQYLRPDLGAIANDSLLYGLRVNMRL